MNWDSRIHPLFAGDWLPHVRWCSYGRWNEAGTEVVNERGRVIWRAWDQKRVSELFSTTVERMKDVSSYEIPKL